MTNGRVMAVVSLVVVLSGQPVFAQSLSRYREYALGSPLASVLEISGARAADARTLHERPARIQELQWRAPYVQTGAALADPVRDVLFRFYDDQLYQVVVSYDRARTAGLTTDDVIEVISKTYGVPALLRVAPARASSLGDVLPADAAIVGRWDDGVSSLTLMRRGSQSPEFQVILSANALVPRARGAVDEATRQDAKDAPQRDLDLRKKQAADALGATEKARILNKAAFKP